ncbi:MAG: hypothetical protein COA73_15730 [Candidatus Hydrogenedentota bacterium]|nr:MAG: hypothetical protein COA73_15730 [Candidatus Hydrogenedentota bacterium]
MENALNISVAICTRNRSDTLRETLEWLVAADRKGLRIEVVVVDNDSDYDTREVVEELADSTRP